MRSPTELARHTTKGQQRVPRCRGRRRWGRRLDATPCGGAPALREAARGRTGRTAPNGLALGGDPSRSVCTPPLLGVAVDLNSSAIAVISAVAAARRSCKRRAATSRPWPHVLVAVCLRGRNASCAWRRRAFDNPSAAHASSDAIDGASRGSTMARGRTCPAPNATPAPSEVRSARCQDAHVAPSRSCH
jgi:hypothetical protein